MPLLLGQIGKRVMSAGWSPSNLMGLLGEQRQFLHDAPPGLASLFGASEATPRANTYERDEVRPVRPHDTEVRNIPAAAHHAAPRRSNAWLWAIPLLALIPLLLFLFGRDGGRRSDVATATPGSPIPTGSPRPTEPTAVATAGRASLGAMMDRRLPNDVTIRVPSNGLENKLLVFIQDPAQGVTKETWFTFDRLEFETNSANLSPGASEQLRSIAEILKAYPQVKVKIGGYTDNAADAADNRTLSEQRATAAMNQIAAFGVDRSRLEAEGYGESHPIADNGTPEGRQQNRRVDIRVTAK